MNILKNKFFLIILVIYIFFARSLLLYDSHNKTIVISDSESIVEFKSIDDL